MHNFSINLDTTMHNFHSYTTTGKKIQANALLCIIFGNLFSSNDQQQFFNHKKAHIIKEKNNKISQAIYRWICRFETLTCKWIVFILYYSLL